MKLKDKIIVVTGGSKGIGLAVSKKIALEGGIVVMCSRNSDDLSKATKELEIISNNKHDYFNVDVSVSYEVNRFKNWIKSKYKKIDGLVNCAGVYGPIGKTVNINIQEFIDALNINLIGTINMCSYFNDIFNNKDKKKIVNFSGGGAASPFPNYSAYATSKVSIVRLTENLSIEMPDFDVNCVAPGFVITSLHEQTLNAGSENVGVSFYENTIKQIENGGVPPEKAADLTAFLLSDESNGISGKFISAAWDPWQEKDFQDLLKNDKDFAVLRRIDNKQFFKK
jgi:NAD(P)-dependent dehydrogenase (short-subunit alcohol dehydrogenase family)